MINKLFFKTSLIILFAFAEISAHAGIPQKVFSILWKTTPQEVVIEAENGRVGIVNAIRGKAVIKRNSTRFISSGQASLLCRIDSACVQTGAGATVVHVQAGTGSFSFFLRDVGSGNPIYIPSYQAIVLPEGDARTYEEVETAILSQKNLTKIQRIERETEVSFADAAARTRQMNAPVWLGMSRDMRMFEISEELEDTYFDEKVIKPFNSWAAIVLPETSPAHVEYRYAVGRGVGVMDNIRRRLEEGVLPIYHSELSDDDLLYHTVSFVSLTDSPLNGQTIRGTDYLVSDSYSGGRIFSEDQKIELQQNLQQDTVGREGVALYIRTVAQNRGTVPRYAWFKAPRPMAGYTFNAEQGFSCFASGRVFCISALDGKPLHQEETAILLQPGQKVTVDFYIPHEPVSPHAAIRLAQQSFEQRHADCKAYWTEKLKQAARIRVPEKRIDEMLRAGLLHLDLITFGREPHGTLGAHIGVYSPIGTESAPIIQYYMSMGLDDIAKRSLTYFMDTQQADGRIQNYNGYMVETGAALWSVGEYFRYTRDSRWIEAIQPKLLKACDYLIRWRAANKDERLRGRGYGMIDGKVADPEDHFHQFMLNGYGYLGLSRMAEAMRSFDPACADSLQKESDAWRNDIRASFFQSLSQSPVVPLGDGTWCPTAAPWAEAPGPRLLFLKREKFRSHGTFTVPDGMLGPMYVLFCEVVEPHEPAAKMLLDYHSELMFQENSTFSQPYYSKHNWYQARTGMVKPFLSTYYHTMAPHADRQTYTFWEHLFRLSPHKTHEEANFLMETRWMLYMEEGDTLHLFRVIPRDWMTEGKEIELDGVQSYFGKIAAKASSHVAQGYIEATVSCDPARKPSVLTLRLPHPEYKKPIKVIGGIYDEVTETVRITPVNKVHTIRLEF